MSVQVAVRVRPFNSRELQLNSKLCVEMDGNSTTLLNLDDPKKNRNFAFDFSFWSHDGFELNEDSQNIPIDDKYADQRKVYELVGTKILQNAWEGYNCCLFAYGQTGAGKSYSMVGYKPNVGIVPIACEEIFKRIQGNDNQNLTYEVSVSMCEIYMEKVQDLLIPTNKRPPGGMNIRESKTIGFYVEGITKNPVNSFDQIQHFMELGNHNRTVASTLMNASSSRAHTLITIDFKQIEIKGGQKFEKFSIINLVDLAGSEKVGQTGATGDRLKEAGQINKSLSTLGLVIERLADQESSKKQVQVPYRDSALTKILSNALGGNSKTLMICALSPAFDNFQETLSTLRYADQAKKIKNQAKVNESATDKVIRELNEENQRLKQLMEEFLKFQNDPSFKFMQGDQQMSQEEVEANIQANNNYKDQLMVSYSDQVVRAKERVQEEEELKIDLTKPYLTNLNEDPLLNGKVTYSLAQDQIRVGRKNGNPTPNIILGGMGIQPNHAIFYNKEQQVNIKPVDSEAIEFIYVNGDQITEEGVELFHLDRLIFGTNSIFLFNHPNGIHREGHNTHIHIDYEFAEQEKTTQAEQIQQKEEQELQAEAQKIKEKQIKQKEEQMQKEKEQYSQQMEIKMKQMEEEFLKKQKELEERMLIQGEKQKAQKEKIQAEKKLAEQKQRMQDEQKENYRKIELEKMKMVDEETRKQNQIKEKHYMQNKLTKCQTKILQVNLIAKELQRNVVLQPKLMYVYNDTDDISKNQLQNEDQSQKMKIQILAQNNEQGQVYHWDLVKFSNRYYMIKEMLEKYFETNEIPKLEDQEDPFWDPAESTLIGHGYLKMLSLSYFMDNPSEITIVGDNGSCGSLRVNLIPTDQEGQKNLSEELENQDDEEYFDDPKQIVGKRLDFRVVIESAQLPDNCCTQTFVQYTLMKGDYQFEQFTTQVQIPKNPRPNFNYDFHHTYATVTDPIFKYISKGTICFQVYGELIINNGGKVQNLMPVEEQFEKQSKEAQSLNNSKQSGSNKGTVPDTQTRKASTLDDPVLKETKTLVVPPPPVAAPAAPKERNIERFNQNNQEGSSRTSEEMPPQRGGRASSVQANPQFLIKNTLRENQINQNNIEQQASQLNSQTGKPNSQDDGVCVIF